MKIPRNGFSLLLLQLVLASVAVSDSDRTAHERLRPAMTPPTLEEVARLGYALGYSPEKRQALWVAHRLAKEDVTGELVPREIAFKRDFEVSNSPEKYDYYGSGFDRGHMAPAGDMEYHRDRMLDSFFMSNISPQTPHINSGVWSSIEDFTRSVAKQHGKVCVITGPIFPEQGGDYSIVPMPHENNSIKAEGGDIPIPVAFYKVLYTEKRGGMMLGFVVPNEDGVFAHYSQFARSVATVERLTGFSFFPDVDPLREEGLREECDIGMWW